MLADRVVLITGASRGLGAALALAFAAAGARLALCARDARRLEAVAARARERGAECLEHIVDIRDEPALARWAAAARERWGTVDVLINNASVLGPRVPLADHPADAWREVMEVNLTGAFLATRAVLPAMLDAGRGVILNVSSGAAIPPRREWGAYAVSKHALEGFTLNLAAELEGTGIRVHAVDPGAMRTSMRAAAYPAEAPEQVKPADAAAAVFLWLATCPADVASGTRFRADAFQAT
jgi:NAD(P)-dependent dehydrogenase (short-subunit alcohol dehydrogenase family)